MTTPEVFFLSYKTWQGVWYQIVMRPWKKNYVHVHVCSGGISKKIKIRVSSITACVLRHVLFCILNTENSRSMKRDARVLIVTGPWHGGNDLKNRQWLFVKKKTNLVDKKHVTREGITKRISNNRLYSVGVSETNSERNTWNILIRVVRQIVRYLSVLQENKSLLCQPPDPGDRYGWGL